MNKNNAWGIKAICLSLMMITAFALSPLSAAASDVLNLGFANQQDIINQNPTRFSVSDDIKIITVSGAGPITITGDGTDGKWGIKITQATEINIEGGTKIIHTTDVPPPSTYIAALEVPGGATIHGNGEGIIISATNTNATNNANVYGIYAALGNITISGDIDEITSAKEEKIYVSSAGVRAARGDVTISGTVGDITCEKGDGIYASGSVTISGTIGDITSEEGNGIYAGGSVTISGTAGNITGGFYSFLRNGISASGSVTISGTVGDITSGNGPGIYASGSVTISGTVGDITGYFNGIYAQAGSVTISGKINVISGDVPIDAASYAVLDYVHPTPLIPDQDKLFPPLDHTVTFDYGTPTPGGNTPKKAYIAQGERKIPEPTAPGYIPVHWYRESGLTTLWNFATDRVSGDITLYAAYNVTVESEGEDATGGGDYAPGDTVSINAGTPLEGKQFKNWTTSPDVTLADAKKAATTFTMPANAVTVTAIFEPIPTYAVTVSSEGTGASGGGSYRQGATVEIGAGTPPVVHRFKNWTTASSGVTLANANNATTTFAMPANAVTVTANFERIGEIIEEGKTIELPGDVGEIKVPPGTRIYDDGKIVLPDGEGGTVSKPDGTEIDLPGGSIIETDGTIRLPDDQEGTVKTSQGLEIDLPGGTEIMPGGKITLPDNETTATVKTSDGGETMVKVSGSMEIVGGEIWFSGEDGEDAVIITGNNTRLSMSNGVIFEDDENSYVVVSSAVRAAAVKKALYIRVGEDGADVLHNDVLIDTIDGNVILRINDSDIGYDIVKPAENNETTGGGCGTGVGMAALLLAAMAIRMRKR